MYRLDLIPQTNIPISYLEIGDILKYGENAYGRVSRASYNMKLNLTTIYIQDLIVKDTFIRFTRGYDETIDILELPTKWRDDTYVNVLYRYGYIFIMCDADKKALEEFDRLNPIAC